MPRRGIRNDEIAGERAGRGSWARRVVDTAGHGRDPSPAPARGRRAGARRRTPSRRPRPDRHPRRRRRGPGRRRRTSPTRTRPAVLAAQPAPRCCCCGPPTPARRWSPRWRWRCRGRLAGPADPRVRSWSWARCWSARHPRLVQRPGRPAPRRQAPGRRQAGRGRPARPGHGVVRARGRGVRGRAAVGRQRRLRRLGVPHLAGVGLPASGSGSARASSRGCRGRRRSRLYPAFLSYGGWGGQYRGDPPEILMTVLAALLGIGVHFLRALWGLVPDNAEGWTYLPAEARAAAGRLPAAVGLARSTRCWSWSASRSPATSCRPRA